MSFYLLFVDITQLPGFPFRLCEYVYVSGTIVCFSLGPLVGTWILLAFVRNYSL